MPDESDVFTFARLQFKWTSWRLGEEIVAKWPSSPAAAMVVRRFGPVRLLFANEMLERLDHYAEMHTQAGRSVIFD